MPKQKKLLHPLFQKLLKAPFSALERRTRYFRLRRRRFRHERVGGYWLDAGIVYGTASNPFFYNAHSSRQIKRGGWRRLRYRRHRP